MTTFETEINGGGLQSFSPHSVSEDGPTHYSYDSGSNTANYPHASQILTIEVVEDTTVSGADSDLVFVNGTPATVTDKSDTDASDLVFDRGSPLETSGQSDVVFDQGTGVGIGGGTVYWLIISAEQSDVDWRVNYSTELDTSAIAVEDDPGSNSADVYKPTYTRHVGGRQVKTDGVVYDLGALPRDLDVTFTLTDTAGNLSGFALLTEDGTNRTAAGKDGSIRLVRSS